MKLKNQKIIEFKKRREPTKKVRLYKLIEKEIAREVREAKKT